MFVLESFAQVSKLMFLVGGVLLVITQFLFRHIKVTIEGLDWAAHDYMFLCLVSEMLLTHPLNHPYCSKRRRENLLPYPGWPLLRENREFGSYFFRQGKYVSFYRKLHISIQK